MSQKVIKAGNSLAVTIPSKFAKNLGLKIGSEVEVLVKQEDGQLTFTFPGSRQLSLIK